MLEAVGEDTKMADHCSPIFRPAFPSSAIISERSSPSRVRFAAPNNGAPLTPPGRSAQHFWEEGKAHSERLPWQGTTSPPFWYPFSPPPTPNTSRRPLRSGLAYGLRHQLSSFAHFQRVSPVSSGGRRRYGHTSGPVGHNMFSDCQGNEAAQEGITRGSEDGDAGADRQAQQGAATDARAASQEGDRIAVWVCFAVEACCQSIAAYFGRGTPLGCHTFPCRPSGATAQSYK